MGHQDAATQTDGPSCCAAVRFELQTVWKKLLETQAQLQEALSGSSAHTRQPQGDIAHSAPALSVKNEQDQSSDLTTQSSQIELLQSQPTTSWVANVVQPVDEDDVDVDVDMDLDTDIDTGSSGTVPNAANSLKADVNTVCAVAVIPERSRDDSSTEEDSLASTAAPSRWLVGVMISPTDRAAAEALVEQEALCAHTHTLQLRSQGSEPIAGLSDGIADAMTIDHQTTKQSPEPHTCPICGRVFRHLSTLTQHTAAEHGAGCGWPQCRRDQCPDCGRGMSDQAVPGRRRQAYLQNKATHSRKRNHICNTCGCRYQRFRDLSDHMNSHTGLRPYVCQICSCTYGRWSTLNVHMRTHTGEKPYSCTVCGKRFAQWSHLYTHKRIHTHEKYICLVCGKAYSQRCDLQQHSRSHIAGSTGHEAETTVHSMMQPAPRFPVPGGGSSSQLGSEVHNIV